jgi:hypothetical protein
MRRSALADSVPYNGRQNRRLSAFSMACEAIRSAHTEDDVVSALRRFLDSLTGPERQQLPWGLGARPMASGADLALWALELSSDRSRPAETVPGAVFGQTVELFSRAAERLVDLRRLA